MSKPREPWPEEREGGEPEILGPEESETSDRGGAAFRGMRFRILSGGEVRKWGGLGCAIALAVLVYSLTLMFAAIIGLNDWLGILGAMAGFLLAVLLRTSIPIIVGAFLCAYNVWGWGWLGSAVFAAPLLVLAIPFLSWNLLRLMLARRYGG